MGPTGSDWDPLGPIALQAVLKTTHRHMGPPVGERVSDCRHAVIIERALHDVHRQLHFFVRVLLGALKFECETLREKIDLYSYKRGIKEESAAAAHKIAAGCLGSTWKLLTKSIRIRDSRGTPGIPRDLQGTTKIPWDP